jgi:hypothetical protein
MPWGFGHRKEIKDIENTNIVKVRSDRSIGDVIGQTDKLMVIIGPNEKPEGLLELSKVTPEDIIRNRPLHELEDKLIPVVVLPENTNVDEAYKTLAGNNAIAVESGAGPMRHISGIVTLSEYAKSQLGIYTDKENQQRIDEDAARHMCPTVLKALEVKKHRQDEIDGKESTEYRTSWNSVFDIINASMYDYDYKNERLRKRILERFRAKNMIRIENDDNPDEIIFIPKPPT